MFITIIMFAKEVCLDVYTKSASIKINVTGHFVILELCLGTGEWL
jgi:hypothetical protein